MNQDGRASTPELVDRYIEWRDGSSVLALFHLVGALHDIDIAADPDNWKSHNKDMASRMKDINLSPEIRLLVNSGLWIYWRMPLTLKKLYWKCIGQEY